RANADTVLQLLASVERASEHPLAAAIVAAAQAKNLPLLDVVDFDSPVGKGVLGTVQAKRVVCGSAKFLAEQGATAPPAGAGEAVRAKGATVIYVAINGEYAGFVGVADPIKASTPAAIRA